MSGDQDVGDRARPRWPRHRATQPATSLLAGLVRDNTRSLLPAAAASVVVAAAELAAPWPLKFVLDDVVGDRAGGFTLTPRDLLLLGTVAAATVGIAGVNAAATYAGDVRLKRTGERVAHDLRVRTYAQLQRLSLSFHDRRQKGDLVTHLTDDANRVGEAFSDSIGSLAQSALLVVGMAAVTTALDPLLGLVLLAVTPVLALVTVHFRRRVRRAARLQRSRDGAIASVASESLSAMRLVQASGTEAREHERVREHSEDRSRHGVELAGLEARFAGVVEVVGAVAVAGVVIVGTLRVAGGVLTAGAIVVFAQYARRLYRPLKDMAKHVTRIGRAAARADRIAEVLAADDVLPDPPHGYTGGRAAGRVELDRVRFGYDGRRAALAGVSLRIEPGEVLAVVGRSGAGKSTIGSLVTRFHDPDSGSVLLDGHDLRGCRLRWVRDQVGVLLQDTVLLSGSIRDNIAYGTDAGEAEVLAAARAADADAFVRALPGGYDTVLGPQGVGLSGGQRQRIGIARVLLRDPSVLVLDEPTTGLDAASEAVVTASLLRLIHGRSTLLVTHSLALALRADRAVVLDRGRVAQEGPPRDLLAAPGPFRSLARRQGLAGAGA